MNPLLRFLDKTQLRQTAFAKRYGFPLSTVNGWVKGTRRPTLEEAFRLERATDGGVPAKAWTEHEGRAA